MTIRVIVLEPHKNSLQTLIKNFRQSLTEKCKIDIVTGIKKLLEKINSGLPYDLVIVDYLFGDGNKAGNDTIKEIRNIDLHIPIVAVASEGGVTLAQNAIDAGATDFLVQGERLQDRVATLMRKIKNIINLVKNNRLLQEQNILLYREIRAKHQIIGKSPQMLEVLERIKRVAQIPRPILILGERGTGKELIAHLIHALAGSGQRPMITVNCAAFPDDLLESELFGHEKGAFTGANIVHHGKFEQAKNGTLFLDEIGNMSLSFQQKILRVVEYKSFTRMGGNSEIKTDTRIITATNANLKKKMLNNEFLRDLYDRLTFEIIQIPPLRERKQDIEILAQHFLEQFIKEIPAIGGKSLSQSALNVLYEYDFPGNVRELKNIIERAAYRDTTSEITPIDLGLSEVNTSIPKTPKNFNEKIEEYKQRLIMEALEQAKYNQALAARNLNISYHQFRHYYRKYIGK